MTREEYLTICSERYDLLKRLNKIDDFYAYQGQFKMIVKDLSREVLDKLLIALPADRLNTHDGGV